VGLQITTNQVLTMAPDASSTSAGKKLANSKHWKSLGQSADALWGECQGSALYQVRVALATLTIQCSCPSRKQPCKHGLGLLLLAANEPAKFPEIEQPDWITEWLAKRAATVKRKETLAAQPAGVSSTPSASQQKTAAKRQAQVSKGIEQFDLWLNDLVRNGLGGLENQPATFWEKQAAQMVDAQVSGLASSVRRLADIPNASQNWPEKLLGQMGKLALLSEAYQHLDRLDAPLQEDVRQQIGWSLKEDEVLAQGEQVSDNWLIVGQTIEEQERGRTQRTWLTGINTHRSALVLQFAYAKAPFSDAYPIGSCLPARLAYWPGAQAQRALIAERTGAIQLWQERMPGAENIEAFLDEVTTMLASCPWRERFLCTLRDVTPIYDREKTLWSLRDREGRALPLNRRAHWHLLAISGGHPLDLAGEWNGEELIPLAAVVNTTYHILEGVYRG
jgi:hypothetical protein